MVLIKLHRLSHLACSEVGSVRKIELAMGDGEKKILDEEVLIARKLREHLDLASNREMSYISAIPA